MTTGSWVQIVCLVLLILFSAFFSASETAFTSLNKIRLKTMADDGNKKAATKQTSPAFAFSGRSC